MENQNYILEAVGITKRFPGVLANDDICLRARAGEILGLIGENGAGKSTILKILTGIYPAGSYQGVLKIDGHEIRPASPHDAIRMGIGFVPQEINVLKHASVAENIYISDLKLGRKRGLVHLRDLQRQAAVLLEDSNINLDPAADVRKLSIGQQQMLMIARALAADPKILILDEPTTSLSDPDVENLFRVVKALKEKGVAVIFVTHKMAEILELTDRLTIMRDGKNISDYERKDYDTAKIIADMIGRKLESMYPQRELPIGAEVLRVESLTVEHPYISKKNLIEGVSFHVCAGEVVGLAGLVGAGRTEVVSTIFGLMKKKSGRLYLNGKEIKINNTKDAIHQGIGLVSEDRKRYGLNFLWSIMRNISISNLKGICVGPFLSKSKEKENSLKYYNSMRIKAPSLMTKVDTLSGGNQQKVVIGRTLYAQPTVVMLDEPTKGIDVGSKAEIYQLINELADQGAAVIMISSELPELMNMCDRFVVMAEGRVAGELRKEDATDATVMELAVKTFKTFK